MKIIYSKTNCPGCVALKARLKAEGVGSKRLSWVKTWTTRTSLSVILMFVLYVICCGCTTVGGLEVSGKGSAPRPFSIPKNWQFNQQLETIFGDHAET